MILFCQSLKCCDFSQVLLVCQSHCVNDVSDFRNVICKDYATKKLQICDHMSLLMSRCWVISKPYSGHYCSSPIECPVVLNVPRFMINIFWDEPVLCIVYVNHSQKHHSDKMAQNPIKNCEFKQLVELIHFHTSDKSVPKRNQIICRTEYPQDGTYKQVWA